MLTDSALESLQARLLAVGQPGLARTLGHIAKGEAKILLVAEGVRLANDPELEADVEAFFVSRGAELVRMPAG